MYRVFIKYCVFFRRFENIPDSGLSLFSFGVSVGTHTRKVEHQRSSRTGRVRKNHNILRKKNTIFNEHPGVNQFKAKTIAFKWFIYISSHKSGAKLKYVYPKLYSFVF